MEAVQASPQGTNSPYTSQTFSYTRMRMSVDVLVIEKTLNAKEEDEANVGINSLPKALTVSAKEILAKLNELLKGSLPEGIESLKPEDTTPEKTSDRIVSGITAMFSAYAKSNKEMEPEELISSFMAAARKGVDQGYGEAFDTLKSLGAFEFEGVQDGIEKTKILIEEKLKAFENALRKQYGLETQETVSASSQESTTSELLASAGSTLSVVA